MLNYLLFFIYLALFCWLLTRINFISNSGIEKKIIVFLFLLRIIAGAINGYINLYHYAGTDIADFHQDGLREYHLLFNDPAAYFNNILNFSYQNSGLLEITDSFWNNLRNVLMVKLASVFDIFSRGNYFINIIFYNFLIFFGSVSFYRLFIKLFPDKKTTLIISLFLLPSLLYFSAGIHKDGLIFLALGICCYNFFHIINGRPSLKKILWLAAGLIIIFLLRNFVLITLLPAMTAWIIAEKNKNYILQSYLVVYLFFIVVFFGLGRLHPALDLPQYVSTRQIAFVQIARGAPSAININPLFPHFRSFLNNSPQALNHSLMRPYLTEKFTLLYIPASIEIFIYEVLLILFLLFRSNKKRGAFIYFCIFFSMSMFLMIGYTIPIIGAIVRYRSIYFPFLVVPILLYTDWIKVKSFLQFKK